MALGIFVGLAHIKELHALSFHVLSKDRGVDGGNLIGLGGA